MYALNEIIDFSHNLFQTKNLKAYQQECGITFDAGNAIKKIAYSTNLTLETVEKAKRAKADLLITHHDAWDFVYGLKEKCFQRLKEYGISHFFSHLPLDDAPFGTNSALLEITGAKEISRHCLEDGFSCAVLGEFDSPIPYEALINRLEKNMQEPVMHWQNHQKTIKKIYILCGGGSDTTFVKEAVDLDADVYISGEKVLYTIQYAKLEKINLVIGSHTFTEIFGVRNFVTKIKDAFPSMDIYEIREDHLETAGFSK
jgi:putative NIF3 family GTP cyclohydrolase 1 type 2